MGAPACPGVPWGLGFETWDPRSRWVMGTRSPFCDAKRGAARGSALSLHPKPSQIGWMRSGFAMGLPKGKEDVAQTVDDVYRSESRRVLATLIYLLGDFDRAEEAMHDAFAAAIEQWPQKGVPANPRAWLVSTGRFKAMTRYGDAQGLTHRSKIFLSSQW